MDTSELSTLAEDLEERFGRPFDVPPEVAGNPELRHLAGHRSVRAFRPEEPPATLVETLLGCALAAPSKSDLQQTSIIRVRAAEQRAWLGELIPRLGWLGGAPLLLVFCADGHRIRRICALRGRPFANEHLDSFFNATVDAALVMMSFIHAAEAVGLGCCPVSVIRNYAGRVAERLELPAHVVPIAALAAGYPAEQPAISPRLPLAVSVHVDRYDDRDLGERIAAYDRRRDRLRPIPARKQRRPEVFGEVELYGWSEDKARQEARPERADFGAFVRARGFGLD